MRDDDPVFGPILQFLAIAFSDQAFDAHSLHSVEQLRTVRVEPPFRCPDFWLEEDNSGCSCVPSKKTLGSCDRISRNHLRLFDKTRNRECHERYSIE